ncbi:MAG TPA: hypothetical protein VFI83_06920 [Gaiella sp.]|jgi:hypothetical protein|nr:hypothetical protein [Gaiella sp.]
MRRSTTRRVAVALVAVPLVVYPAIALRNGVHFPSPADCVLVAKPGDSGDLDLVFGRRDTPAEANALLARVKRVGYVDAQVQEDGCLRWKVVYTGIESYEQGASSAAEARSAGLQPQIEVAPPG